MLRIAFALAIVAAGGVQSAAQTASPDTQALQALVAEIRQLRQDLQATTVATQRVQIVLYRLQMQTALVTNAASRLDDARTSLGKFQSDKKIVAGRVLQFEEELKSEQNPAKRKEMENMVTAIQQALHRHPNEEVDEIDL